MNEYMLSFTVSDDFEIFGFVKAETPERAREIAIETITSTFLQWGKDDLQKCYFDCTDTHSHVTWNFNGDNA